MIDNNRANLLIVIPTYNAKVSIIKVVSEIIKEMPNVKIVIVDDNSPDQTAQLIKNKFGSNFRVKLIIRRHKGGRGSAVIDGFKEGLEHKNFKFFIEMDADFAHNPKDIQRLIQEAKKFDVVVASRYLNRSQIVRWGLKRRLISRFANLWIKLMLGISLSDNTSGFRCYNRSVIEAVDFDLIKSRGFIVLTEIAYQIHKYGFRFGEIPINFTPVDFNKSNLNIKEVKEAFFTVLRLKINSFLKFDFK